MHSTASPAVPPSPSPLHDLAPDKRPAPALTREVVRALSAAGLELLGPLGVGGMGVVYRARDRRAGRDVALKLPPPGSDRGKGHKPLSARLRREGEISARLRHPGIVRLHEAGEAGGLPYLTFELVGRGRTLEETAAGLPLVGRVALLREAARALSHAHMRGVVHRDVKPSNILIDDEGHARLTDFGLALDKDAPRLTDPGTVLGSPFYAAPEQLDPRSGPVSPATDVWSLGVILYWLLCDALPFDADTFHGILAKIGRGKPPLPSSLRPDVPPALEALCVSALTRDPRRRPPDARAFARAIEAWEAGVDDSEDRVWKRRAGALSAVAVVVWVIALFCAGAPHARAAVVGAVKPDAGVSRQQPEQ